MEKMSHTYVYVQCMVMVSGNLSNGFSGREGGKNCGRYSVQLGRGAGKSGKEKIQGCMSKGFVEYFDYTMG